MDQNRLQVEQDGPKVDIVGWLSEGWRQFKSAPGIYALTSFVFLVVMLLSQAIPWVGTLIVAGPMMIGLYLVVADQVAARPYSMQRLFGGFAFLVPAFLVNLLVTVFTMIGFMLLIIPGMVIGSWYLLVYFFVADRDMDFWQAMEASRKVAFTDMVGFTLFYASLIVINFIGALFFVVGLLVTLPVTAIATFVAYEQMVGVNKLLVVVDASPTIPVSDEGTQ